MSSYLSATAFAPATVANVGVGFDLLGFATDSVGDEVTVTRLAEKEICLETLEGSSASLPQDVSKNCATAGLLALIKDLKTDFGFRVSVKKGIPVGSGMGGSAASAVAAIVAANALLDAPLRFEEIFHYALLGEKVASGALHPDNIAPCLLGGLTMARLGPPAEVVQIPVPKNIICVLVHPHLRVDTREARAVLKETVTLKKVVEASGHLAGFLCGCFKDDLKLIQSSLRDIIIEPQRSSLIQGFSKVHEAALVNGALGCAIAGSGPSLFAWVDSALKAKTVGQSMVQAFQTENVMCDSWIFPIHPEGARVIRKK